MDLVFLTGYSGAGKSTVADHLTKHHQFGYVSFRTLTKGVAENRGYTHLDYLQQVDNATIFKEVSTEMIKQLSEQKSEAVLIDGLYHYPYVKPIQEAFQDSKVIILAIEADRAIREPRMVLRDPNDKTALNNLEYLDNYKDSIGIGEVLEHADVVIVNNVDMNTLLVNTDAFALSLK